MDARLTGAPYCESLNTKYSSGGLDGEEELQAWVMGFLDGTTQLAGCDSDLQGIMPNSQPVRKKEEEKTHTKENNHTHKTVFTWFNNLPMSTKLQGYHYYQGRIQSTTCGYNIFFSI